MTTEFFWLKIDSTDKLLWSQQRTYRFYKMHEFPLLRRPQEEVSRIVRMSTLQILHRLHLFSTALQSGGLSHQLKALVVNKGYHKVIIINTRVNKARRL